MAGKQQQMSTNVKIDLSKPIEQRPAHLAERSDMRGSENVGSSDIIIPRIEVVQAQSKCLKKTEPGYIATAKPGLMYNNVTRHVFGSQAVLCPIFFKKEWLLWVDRKAKGATGGNGFRGAFQSEAEAIKAKRELGDDGKDLLVTETHQHFCIVIVDGKMEDVVLSMSRTKLKVSKAWNSLIRLNGGDRFGRMYRVGTAEESNDKGDFFNFTIGNFGFAPQAVYERAEGLYELAMKGNLHADTSFEEEGSGDDGGKKTEY